MAATSTDTSRPRRVVLLGRVSRGERQQDPEGQLGPLRAAAARLGWTVVKEVPLKLSAWDEAAAADVRRQALAPIEAGEADTLMIWAWDRFSREGLEGPFRELRYLEDHLGAALWSLQEPFLSIAAPREQRELLLSIIAWTALGVAAQERASSRWRAAPSSLLPSGRNELPQLAREARALPGEPAVGVRRSAEVAVGGGARVDGAVEPQALADAAWGERHERAERLFDELHVPGLRFLAVEVHRDGLGDADA